MSDLAAVLAAHWDYGPTANFDGWECTCGTRISDTSEGALDKDMQAHLAEQVTAWLAEWLAAPEMREAVDAAIEDLWPSQRAEAALAVVAARLAGDA